MKKKKNRFHTVFLLSIVIIVVLIGLYSYNRQLKRDLEIMSCDTLEEIIMQQKNNFKTKFDGDKDALIAFADLISLNDQFLEDPTVQLSMIAKERQFEYASFATPDGNTISNQGDKSNISDREYFNRSMAGETVISEPMASKIRDTNIVVLSTPVWKNDEIIGVLFVSYDSAKLDQLFSTSFGGRGYTYVMDKNGNIVLKTVNSYSITTTENVYDTFSKATFYEHDNYEAIQYNFQMGNQGHTKYKIGNQKRFAHYMSLEVNDWILMVVVPEEVITEQTASISERAFLLTFILCFVFAALCIYIYKSQHNHLNEISKIAYEDELTGIANLYKFKKEVNNIFLNKRREEFYLMRVDISDFKLVNDMFGYTEGNKVLVSVADFLKKSLNENDLVARISNDDFILLMESKTERMLMEIRGNLDREINSQRLLSNSTYRIDFVAGIYKIKEDDEDINVMLDRVAMAHKKAKITDEAEVVVYNDVIRDEAVKIKEIENTMEAALTLGEFKVYAQPKFDLDTLKISGAESLIRWQDKSGKVVRPDEFIPIFEKNGFVIKIDDFVLEETCKYLRMLIDKGITPVPISVNQSRLHMKSPHYIEKIKRIINKYNIPPNLIELELTESIMHENLEQIMFFEKQLTKLGITLSIDDFGSGYSSLNILKDVNAKVLKIDRLFLINSEEDHRGKTVLTNIIRLAKELDMRVVTEGVETKAQELMLKEIGSDMVQGFLYAKPMPIADLEELL